MDYIKKGKTDVIKHYLLDNNTGFKIAKNANTIEYYTNDGELMEKPPLIYETHKSYGFF